MAQNSDVLAVCDTGRQAREKQDEYAAMLRKRHLTHRYWVGVRRKTHAEVGGSGTVYHVILVPRTDTGRPVGHASQCADRVGTREGRTHSARPA